MILLTRISKMLVGIIVQSAGRDFIPTSKPANTALLPAIYQRGRDSQLKKKIVRTRRQTRTCTCQVCGKQFEHFHYHKKLCPEHTWRGTRKELLNCPQCNRLFYTYKSRPKIHCSYKCHIDSGGARRAGEASVKMVAKYGAKKDANHKEIVDAFFKLGADVLDISSMGCGMPDLVVWCRNLWHLVDVKNLKTAYGRRGLNKRQIQWAKEWKGGPIYLISTIEQAADLVNGKTSGLKQFPPRVSTPPANP